MNGGSRPVIGVLFPMYWSINYLDNFLSIKKVARELDINIIFLQGLYNYNSETYSHIYSNYDVENTIFNLAGNNLLDGIIVFSNTVYDVKQKKLILNLVKNRFDIPLINVGSQIDGVRNILVDNMSGMNKLFDHLIRYHNYSRIAFVRGPYGHSDASIRYKLYIDALSEYGIPYDENLVSMPGPWSVDTGEKAAKALLEKNSTNIDVIVCASDILARGVVNYLDTKNIFIPDQIAVTGFGNTHFSMCQSSPLTTITLNLNDRCRVALEEMVKIINGVDVPENIYIKSSMVLRQSCGCLAPGVRILTEKTEQPDYVYSENIEYEKFHEMLTDEIADNLLLTENDQTLKHQIYKYVRRFYAQIENVNESNFMHDCSEIFNETCTVLEDSSVWHRVINIIENKIDPTISENKRAYASHLLLQTRIILGELGEECCNVKLLKIEERNSVVNSMFFNLSKVNSFSKIQEILENDLPRLDIPVCYITLYKDNKEPLQQSLFFSVYEKNQSKQLPPAGSYYETCDLLKQIVAVQVSPFSLIIEPLFYHNRQLGLVVFDIGPPEHSFYELFPTLLSSAIWNAELNDSDIMNEAALEEKRVALDAANQKVDKMSKQSYAHCERIKENRGNIIIKHKLATMGFLTSDIVSEFEKNITSINNEIDKMQKAFEQYTENTNSISPEQECVNATMQQVLESAGSAGNVLESLQFFTQIIKEQVTDYREDVTTRFTIADIVTNVLVFLSPCYVNKSIDVKVEIEDEHIILEGSGVNLSTILTNLLIHSICTFKECLNAVIKINVKKISRDVVVVISDNGPGIEPELLPDIFVPSLTGKRTDDRSGIGLCIVKDIVTEEFGGTINADSIPGSGSTFTITIPVK
jgi:DNA-binding LacI/PurR family transcriptional regulator/signal transduction histidine kinase